MTTITASGAPMPVVAAGPVQIAAGPATPIGPTTQRSSILKGALVGGALGAAVGAGLTFTSLPFIGALAAPIGAAIGGVAGLVIGGAVAALRYRSALDGARVGASLPTMTPPPPPQVSGPLPPSAPR